MEYVNGGDLMYQVSPYQLNITSDESDSVNEFQWFSLLFYQINKQNSYKWRKNIQFHETILILPQIQQCGKFKEPVAV